MEIGAIYTVTLCFGLLLLKAAVYGSKRDLSHSAYCNAYDSDIVRCGCSNHSKVYCKVQDEFLRSSIVPDYIPCIPCCELKLCETLKWCTGQNGLRYLAEKQIVTQVEYPNGEKMHLGNTVSTNGVSKQPRVQYKASYHRNFTIMILGLGGTTETVRGPTAAIFLVTGIRGSDINQGDAIVAYLSTSEYNNPQAVLSLGCMVYLLYEEGPMFTPVTALERARFAVPVPGLFYPNDFAAQHNLGNPVCANFARVNRALH